MKSISLILSAVVVLFCQTASSSEPAQIEFTAKILLFKPNGYRVYVEGARGQVNDLAHVEVMEPLEFRGIKASILTRASARDAWRKATTVRFRTTKERIESSARGGFLRFMYEQSLENVSLK